MKKRFAIITDIHGNIEGLNAILKDIENKKIDESACKHMLECSSKKTHLIEEDT